ncbi:hypothetical protein BKA61DRAFT_311101 [Leptodontidium sp. MPI-SDFR-AT-0119]|nr:hypothetical protein BKA61DRAFT_311101 [Leptodontidium sp. MPI-SDFR-AT-0119]
MPLPLSLSPSPLSSGHLPAPAALSCNARPGWCKFRQRHPFLSRADSTLGQRVVDWAQSSTLLPESLELSISRRFELRMPSVLSVSQSVLRMSGRGCNRNRVCLQCNQCLFSSPLPLVTRHLPFGSCLPGFGFGFGSDSSLPACLPSTLLLPSHPFPFPSSLLPFTNSTAHLSSLQLRTYIHTYLTNSIRLLATGHEYYCNIYTASPAQISVDFCHSKQSERLWMR